MRACRRGGGEASTFHRVESVADVCVPSAALHVRIDRWAGHHRVGTADAADTRVADRQAGGAEPCAGCARARTALPLRLGVRAPLGEQVRVVLRKPLRALLLGKGEAVL
eukprot:4207205-Pleurochrysis_carterae.AAC.1